MSSITKDALKRSSRQRVPTKRFEYQGLTDKGFESKTTNAIEESIDDNVRKTSATHNQATDKTDDRYLPRAKQNKATVRHQSESETDNIPRKRHWSGLRSFPIHSDVSADSEGEQSSSDNAAGGTRDTTPHSIASDKTKESIARALAESDLAIEQSIIESFYTDPFQRHKPDDKAYDLWCRENLERLIYGKGLTQIQAQRITNWILSLSEEGIRPYSDSPQRKRGEKAVPGQQKSLKSTTSPFKRKIKASQAIVDVGSRVNDPEQDHQSLIDDETDADDASMVSSTANGGLIITGNEDSCENIPEITSKAPEELTAIPYDELSIEQQRMVIKERLKLFNWVYGEGKPERDPSKWEDKLEYFSPVANHPRSVPKGGFRTQGHSRLQVVTLPQDDSALHNNVIPPSNYAHLDKNSRNHGLNFNQSVPHPREVLTEDPNFGITRYPKDETETPEGLEVYNNDRCVKHRSRQEMANDHSKPVEEIRIEEAEAAEADFERARIDLGIKRWDWETPDAMKGLWVDLEAGRTTFDPNTFGFGPIDRTWQKIQEKKQKLALSRKKAEQSIQK